VHLFWPIKADLQIFDSIILALSVNANDAMPTGGTLTWSTKNITITELDTFLNYAVPAGEYVILAATDTGRWSVVFLSRYSQLGLAAVTVRV
jgi:two-component system cell cycle sensor histidine kinase/response regulator CckA